MDKFEMFSKETSYQTRRTEFVNSVKRGKENYDVVLPWSHYHALQSSPSARVFDDPAKAEAYADPGDQIVTTDLRNAASLAAAFDILCAYAWTPNQTAAEQSESRVICNIAAKIIDKDSR